MSLGELIREIRKQRNYTLRELGDLTNISFSQIGKIENDTHRPSKEKLEILALALDLDLEKLLQYAGYKEQGLEPIQLLRYNILTRDKFTCQLCGSKAPEVKVQMSHIIPITYNGNTEEDNLICLCSNCHLARNKTIQEKGLENDFLYVHRSVK